LPFAPTPAGLPRPAAGLTRAKRQLVVVCAGSGSAADPLVRAVRRRDDHARLTWLHARLEEGRRQGALPELQPQAFSNEEQMLAQAAQWQQQAAAHSSQQAAAAAAPPVQEPAAQSGWPHAGHGALGSGAAAPERLAAVRRQLQQREGLSEAEAAGVVRHLRLHAPGALADWDRAAAAAAWLGERLGGGAVLCHLARAAPQLLEADVGRLQTCWSFLEQRPQFEAGGGGSVLEGLHALRCELGAAPPGQQQQQQQQHRAQAG
jgi:pyruvate/2-oxoglutarate dehydrogenase complex dihydrolipoamide acyltransferase (E2) component